MPPTSDQRRPPSSPARAAAAPPGAVSPWVQLRSASQHPFIFKRMILSADAASRPGDIVNVYDKSNRLFGRALYNPRSQIVLRMLTHEDLPIDDAFWRGALQNAIDLRRRLNLDAATDAYRLVHAEGDALSGLIVERYADCLVFEVFSLGMFQRWRALAGMLADLLGPPASLDRSDQAPPSYRTVVRADPHIEQIEGFRVPPDERPDVGRLIIREHGIRYRVDPAAGHKTGFFCDQRDNRRRLGELCRGGSVLDLCCYTGGFSLCARLLGGAEDITAVDLDEAALAIARENVNLNNTRVNIVHSDAFIYLRQMLTNRRTYDTVVLDPPKFVSNREEMDDGLRKYHDLNSLAMQVVKPGGIFLTCSCSGLVGFDALIETVHRAARRAGRQLQMFERTAASPDHPVMLNCPESAYLKALWLRVL